MFNNTNEFKLLQKLLRSISDMFVQYGDTLATINNETIPENAHTTVTGTEGYLNKGLGVELIQAALALDTIWKQLDQEKKNGDFTTTKTGEQLSTILDRLQNISIQMIKHLLNKPETKKTHDLTIKLAEIHSQIKAVSGKINGFSFSALLSSNNTPTLFKPRPAMHHQPPTPVRTPVRAVHAV